MDLCSKIAVKMGDRATIPGKGKSAFTGVSWCKAKKMWKAQIQKDGKSTNLGCFDDEEAGPPDDPPCSDRGARTYMGPDLSRAPRRPPL